MPKRSLDISNVAPDATSPVQSKAVQRKTERSHEENQERAYIAASRRADRSIEARVKSAQMASEIHKKRTGKGFKISERIVQAEEMYEEEEDDMPRSYRMLAAHLQTGSHEMNTRVNAFLANRVAMASMVAGMRNEDWLQNPINKMFAEQFPHADKQAQAMNHRLSDSSYYGPVAGTGADNQTPTSPNSTIGSPMSPSFGNVNYQAQGSNYPNQRSNSVAMSPTDREGSQTLSPTMPADGFTSNSMPPTDPLLYPNDSAFTAELPLEAKMMLGPSLDRSDPMASLLMGGNNNMPPYYTEEDPSLQKQDFQQQPDFFGSGMPTQFTTSNYPGFDGSPSNVGTPGPGGPNDNWDNFMDWSGCGENTNEPFRG